ncbi:hypothetical protein TW95_gp0789 [Pandoravirus inopinatum]|uniref:Uncharacterized protein n=1 Tax=Pandoravirus inopinatum TaxID=1605721 RepID=A0A0B5IXL7_9VIRU|nr:hypothetical protein TW95_gp0789 [Pandoravirus inopinatum]AJF97523.1 hypothetical protein [Pandoravirus inopinatum]
MDWIKAHAPLSVHLLWTKSRPDDRSGCACKRALTTANESCARATVSARRRTSRGWCVASMIQRTDPTLLRADAVIRAGTHCAGSSINGARASRTWTWPLEAAAVATPPSDKAARC